MTKRHFVIKRIENIQTILSKHCTLYPLREGFKTTVTKSTFPLSERIVSLADKGVNPPPPPLVDDRQQTPPPSANFFDTVFEHLAPKFYCLYNVSGKIIQRDLLWSGL